MMLTLLAHRLHLELLGYKLILLIVFSQTWDQYPIKVTIRHLQINFRKQTHMSVCVCTCTHVIYIYICMFINYFEGQLSTLWFLHILHLSALGKFFFYIWKYISLPPQTTMYIILILKDNTFANKLTCSYKLLIKNYLL